VIALLDARAPEVEPAWRALQARAAPSYFQSWGWIDTWLDCLDRTEAPRLLLWRDGARPLAAGFLGRRHLVRHRLVPSTALFLNTSGVPAHDELCVEHNELLSDPDARALALADLVAAIPGEWDELTLPALRLDRFPGRALAEPVPGHRVLIDRESTAPWVDLARVRATDGGYLALLPANTRAQVRRAERGFGPLTIEVAADLDHAREIYAELVELHRARWRERGEPGAFADPWVDRFHRALITRRFPHGELQLVRVRAGARTVGCLYNLVLGDRVAFYQSGLGAFDDPHLKPGYVCHAEAIALNAAAGRATYDFLAGASRYKRSLATDERRLVWARVQRRRVRFAVEEELRAWKHRAGRALDAARQLAARLGEA
jgi:CelD/BcsL family acetyltransferase involved in cellulose biosynthesis